jgi:hypothetical protein
MVTVFPPTVPVAVSAGLPGAPPCANTVPAAAKIALQTNKRLMQILLGLGTSFRMPSQHLAGMIVALPPPLWELLSFTATIPSRE